MQVCDGVYDCPPSETTGGGEDEDDCDEGASSWNWNNACKEQSSPLEGHQVVDLALLGQSRAADRK